VDLVSNAIVVRAPATSANLGSGFDCLGVALDLWNDVRAFPGRPERDRDNLILRAARCVFEETGAAYPEFELQCINRIPFGRGLGSSAAAIVCGVLLANAYLEEQLNQSDCLRLAAQIEGHADNVAPCLLGGARVATTDERGHVIQAGVHIQVPLEAVVFVPDLRIATVEARARLPKRVLLDDALFNVARASLLVAALASGAAELLDEATRDRLHQPYRLELFPAGGELIAAARAAGALAACISGAGPSVLALCGRPEQTAAVQAAFTYTAGAAEIPGSILRLAISQQGAHVDRDHR
jgi:homoserine kinase